MKGVEDVEAVTRWLTSKGLNILEADAGRRRIVVEGPAAKVNAAFAIKLNWYRAPDRRPHRPRRDKDGQPIAPAAEREIRYRGFEGPVHLTAELIGIVVAIVGLDNRQVGGPAAVGTGDPPNASYLSPPAVAQLYDLPNTGATASPSASSRMRPVAPPISIPTSRPSSPACRPDTTRRRP